MTRERRKGQSSPHARGDVERLQKEHYEEVAPTYVRYLQNEHAEKYRRSILNLAFNDVDVTGKKVLDAMCGGGELSSYFVSRGADVIGADISENFCRIYGERFGQDKALCTSVFETGLADETFDIVAVAGLHHLHPHVDRGFGELGRVLKPGGLLFFWEPVKGTFFDLLRKVWYSLDRKYIKENEAAVDIEQMVGEAAKQFKELRRAYVGSIAHLLVLQALILRIPLGFLRFYAPVCIPLEGFLNRLQLKWLSCNVVCLMKKR